MAADQRPKGLSDSWAQAQPYVDATWEFIAATGLCTAGGWWLDTKFHTKPWLMVAGSVFGFSVGMWVMFRRMLSLNARDKAEADRKAADAKKKDGP